MKYFVFSDVHGDYGSLIDALEEAGYNPHNENHQIISLGDNFGRADDTAYGQGGSFAIYRYLTSQHHARPPICIRGNHESILLDILNRGRLTYTDIMNGEDRTLTSFSNVSDARWQIDEAISLTERTGVRRWIQKMSWYFTTKNYIFVHGFLPHTINDYCSFEQIPDEDWHEASWCDTIAELSNETEEEAHDRKTVVLGHFGNTKLRQKLENYPGIDNSTWYSDRYNVIGLDATTLINHMVNVAVIEDEIEK
jgi:hypothetical protein